MDVAVVGCGHMGRHHARTVARDPHSRLVALVDIVPERARRLSAEFGGEPRTTVPEGVDVVVVATPTGCHADVARPLLDSGRWCFVEKPLANTVAVARELMDERLVVGHIERFNPAVRAAGPLAPRYVEARRLAPPSGRSGDIDVVLDLMIHDLDLVLAWSDQEVSWVDAVGVAVQSEQTDHASVRLRTADGLVATLVSSRVAERPQRSVRLYENGRHTYLDLLTGRARRAQSPLARVDDKDALTAQWDAFTAAVHGRAPAVVDHRAGMRAVALAERIRGVISGASATA